MKLCDRCIVPGTCPLEYLGRECEDLRRRDCPDVAPTVIEAMQGLEPGQMAEVLEAYARFSGAGNIRPLQGYRILRWLKSGLDEGDTVPYKVLADILARRRRKTPREGSDTDDAPAGMPLTVEPETGTWADAGKFVPPENVPVLVAWLDHGRNLHASGQRTAVYDHGRQCWQWAEYARYGQGYILDPVRILAWTGCPEAPRGLLGEDAR